MSLSVSAEPSTIGSYLGYICNQVMATLCAFCETFYEHSHHGVMVGDMLLLHFCMRAFKQNVSCTIVSLAPWQQAS